MNERTERQIGEMKKQTIGVEVEMNNITRQNAAKVAAEYFGTGRSEDTAYRNGYRTWSAWDAQGREWKFSRDVSIEGLEAEQCELVTPILRYEDMELLQGLIRKPRKAGAKSDADRGCGVHIHIGANGHTPQTLRNLANIMASHEELLVDALGLTRNSKRYGHYCKPVDPNFLRQLNQRKPKTMAALADVWYNFYYKHELDLDIVGIKSKKVRRRRVFVYIMHEERQIEIPGNGYMRVCLEGYKDFGFNIAPLLEAYDHSLEVAQ